MRVAAGLGLILIGVGLGLWNQALYDGRWLAGLCLASAGLVIAATKTRGNHER